MPEQGELEVLLKQLHAVVHSDQLGIIPGLVVMAIRHVDQIAAGRYSGAHAKEVVESVMHKDLCTQAARLAGTYGEANYERIRSLIPVIPRFKTAKRAFRIGGRFASLQLGLFDGDALGVLVPAMLDKAAPPIPPPQYLVAGVDDLALDSGVTYDGHHHKMVGVFDYRKLYEAHRLEQDDCLIPMPTVDVLLERVQGKALAGFLRTVMLNPTTPALVSVGEQGQRSFARYTRALAAGAVPSITGAPPSQEIYVSMLAELKRSVEAVDKSVSLVAVANDGCPVMLAAQLSLTSVVEVEEAARVSHNGDSFFTRSRDGSSVAWIAASKRYPLAVRAEGDAPSHPFQDALHGFTKGFGCMKDFVMRSGKRVYEDMVDGQPAKFVGLLFGRYSRGNDYLQNRPGQPVAFKEGVDLSKRATFGMYASFAALSSGAGLWAQSSDFVRGDDEYERVRVLCAGATTYEPFLYDLAVGLCGRAGRSFINFLMRTEVSVVDARDDHTASASVTADHNSTGAFLEMLVAAFAFSASDGPLEAPFPKHRRLPWEGAYVPEEERRRPLERVLVEMVMATATALTINAMRKRGAAEGGLRWTFPIEGGGHVELGSVTPNVLYCMALNLLSLVTLVKRLRKDTEDHVRHGGVASDVRFSLGSLQSQSNERWHGMVRTFGRGNHSSQTNCDLVVSLDRVKSILDRELCYIERDVGGNGADAPALYKRAREACHVFTGDDFLVCTDARIDELFEEGMEQAVNRLAFLGFDARLGDDIGLADVREAMMTPLKAFPTVEGDADGVLDELAGALDGDDEVDGGGSDEDEGEIVTLDLDSHPVQPRARRPVGEGATGVPPDHILVHGAVMMQEGDERRRLIEEEGIGGKMEVVHCARLLRHCRNVLRAQKRLERRSKTLHERFQCRPGMVSGLMVAEHLHNILRPEGQRVRQFEDMTDTEIQEAQRNSVAVSRFKHTDVLREKYRDRLARGLPLEARGTRAARRVAADRISAAAGAATVMEDDGGFGRGGPAIPAVRRRKTAPRGGNGGAANRVRAVKARRDALRDAHAVAERPHGTEKRNRGARAAPGRAPARPATKRRKR